VKEEEEEEEKEEKQKTWWWVHRCDYLSLRMKCSAVRAFAWFVRLLTIFFFIQKEMLAHISGNLHETEWSYSGIHRWQSFTIST